MSKRAPRFVVYQAADGWRWRLLAANNRIVATGEAHTRERDAWRAVQTIVATVLDVTGEEPEWMSEAERMTAADDAARVH